MDTKKAGIDGIVTVMDTILDVGMDIAKAMDDKKLSLPETIALSKHIPGAIGAVKAAPDLPAELLDLDNEEREQIIAHFAEKFDLPNDEVEKRVERLFRVAVNLSVEIAEVVEIVKDFRADD